VDPIPGGKRYGGQPLGRAGGDPLRVRSRTPGSPMTATRRHLLADRRKAMGFSQERLAEKLAVDRSTVVRWEACETDPQPWVRPKLAAVLELSLDQLGELLTASPQSTSVLLSTAVAASDAPSELGAYQEEGSEGDDMNRRELLRLMTDLIGSGSTTSPTARVDLTMPSSMSTPRLTAICGASSRCPRRSATLIRLFVNSSVYLLMHFSVPTAKRYIVTSARSRRTFFSLPARSCSTATITWMRRTAIPWLPRHAKRGVPTICGRVH
jgi:transcriptional regulator with XRE-family HTH domain